MYARARARVRGGQVVGGDGGYSRAGYGARVLSKVVSVYRFFLFGVRAFVDRAADPEIETRPP